MSGSDISGSDSSRAKTHSGETRRQLFRFVVVGVSCVLVDLAVYRLLGWTMGLRLDVAKGLSYWAGVCVGFVGNKLWTFQSKRKSLSEPVTYLAQYSLTMLVNVGCNRLALTVLGPQATALAYLFATGVTTVLNFAGMRLVTFRRGISERHEKPAVVDDDAEAVPATRALPSFPERLSPARKRAA